MSADDKPRGSATIHDVAREAGVSIGTVSKALNGTGSLSDDTRKRVMETVRALHFRPNTLARSLHTGLSGSVGVISNDSFGRFTMPIMEGLEGVLSGSGIGVFMVNATDDAERERAHLDQLLAKQIDGLIVTARRADRRPSVDLSGLGVPVIYVFSQGDAPGALTLLPDDQGGARLATDHLIQRGRRRIAHVTGPEDFEAVRLRAAGWREGVTAAGLEPGPLMHGSWTEAWGRAAVAQLLNGPRPDAIVCGNDLIARGCADALREAGIACPTDIALTGFDNWTVMAEACRPALTSVDMNLIQLGAHAGHKMTEMIKGEDASGTLRLPCTLVVRDST
ncbi:MAG: LacI family DNA-binding transcriptional regulator [Tabrizicola sp.]|uniref:LacI family DNA-binding transcriptional regulator n=1 Tax=Tabrizicola sp. TaxID=2005166 RepID=UPI002ABBBC0F|nr:LacI family DNA-binding transcriptional regulator [Tabrizicola sp.]MDZ4085862.1 LacI family DNA-binding transcriptional regulator [Tabrizicola sp.]